MKISGVLVGGVVAALLCGVANAQTHGSGHGSASRAKVTMGQARAIALRAVNGRVIGEELEREKGGSGRRYSFVIRMRTKTYEVGIDAATGRVLERKTEGSHPD